MTVTIREIEDHGVWRGKHRWALKMEDEHGRASIEAIGATVADAISHASETFENRLSKRLSPEQKDAVRRSAEALRRAVQDEAPFPDPNCGFCRGGSVGNAASWLDDKPRPPAPCPRCGGVARP